jgi:hypothetical protein
MGGMADTKRNQDAAGQAEQSLDAEMAARRAEQSPVPAPDRDVNGEPLSGQDQDGTTQR